MHSLIKTLRKYLA